MPTVLVADDDGHIREVLRYALEKAGHRVLEAGDGKEALLILREQPVDLAVLDIIMPQLDGMEVCRSIRAESPLPVLFLTSRDDEVDRVLGLEMGADDYVTKPFSPREVVARVKAILRRLSREEAPREERVIGHGGVTLDLDRHTCRCEGGTVDLTVTEFSILQTLMGFPGKVYARGELVDRVYGHGHHVTERTVDSHVRRIRKKLSEAGAGEPIETVHGVGYRLRA